MRKKLSLLCMACVLFCGACNFSAGTNKDFSTGLSYSYNGFRVDRVVLAGPDNAAMTNNEVALNTAVAIVMEGVSNYALKDDKVFPGMALNVTGKDGVAVISEADLFADGTEGYAATDAAILRSKITIGTPMVSGGTYHVKVRVWDKVKPENELTAEVDLVVK